MRYNMLSRKLTSAVRESALWLSVLALWLLPSCKDNSNPGPPFENPPNGFQTATFPLAQGNQWAYVDSNLVEPTLTKLDMCTISGYSSGWWNFDVPGGRIYLCAKNDTILLAKTGQSPNIGYLPNPPLGDTVVFSTQYSATQSIPVKVYLLKEPVVTPAGTFDSCSVYESYDRPNGSRIVTYYRPRVGPVMYEIYHADHTRLMVNRMKLVYVKLWQ